jgi:hypothetical protein
MPTPASIKVVYLVLVTRPNAPNESPIILQTRKGRNIENAQSKEFSLAEERGDRDLVVKFPGIVTRAPLNPMYNCHGLVFASRRTGIFDNTALNTILADDGYVQIQRHEVLPGDVILYFAPDGVIEHSGIVVSSPEAPLFIAKVVSKWGRAREVLHWANECPYPQADIRYYRSVQWK